MLEAEVQAQQSLAAGAACRAPRQVRQRRRANPGASPTPLPWDDARRASGRAGERRQSMGTSAARLPLAADGVLGAVVSPLVLHVLGTELVFPPRPATLTRKRVKITMPKPSL